MSEHSRAPEGRVGEGAAVRALGTDAALLLLALVIAMTLGWAVAGPPLWPRGEGVDPEGWLRIGYLAIGAVQALLQLLALGVFLLVRLLVRRRTGRILSVGWASAPFGALVVWVAVATYGFGEDRGSFWAALAVQTAVYAIGLAVVARVKPGSAGERVARTSGLIVVGVVVAPVLLLLASGGLWS
ncbi:hypothetical protein [Demequina maris]|uniref:hypothetical protein n=1 Tax=Demequina maris TaxID=1638982 RepID=UPI0007824A9D|nr:hypothetical protein [Demequina maris]